MQRLHSKNLQRLGNVRSAVTCSIKWILRPLRRKKLVISFPGTNCAPTIRHVLVCPPLLYTKIEKWRCEERAKEGLYCCIAKNISRLKGAKERGLKQGKTFLQACVRMSLVNSCIYRRWCLLLQEYRSSNSCVHPVISGTLHFVQYNTGFVGQKGNLALFSL